MPRHPVAEDSGFVAHREEQGRAIREALRRSGLTRSEAAVILGVNLYALQSYCYGQRRCPPEIRFRIIDEMNGDPITLGPDADACPHCGRAW